MSQVLPGQRLLESDYEPVEQGLRKFITDLVFRTLAQIWKQEVGRRLDYENSTDSDRTSLIKALRSGRMQYSIDARGGGVFSGETSASLGRALRALGANFDSRERIYRIKPESIPPEVLASGAAHAAACERAHQRMDRFLVGVQGQLDQYVARMDPSTLRADQMIANVTREFQTGVQRVGIPFVKPDAAARAAMSAAYTHNAQLWIKKWVAEDIVRLRHQVEANVRSGARASTLAARISQRYQVSASKARFLSRQESGLWMAAYHKEQYLGAGVPRYVWSTSKDCDVRNGHKQLEGRVFTWSEGAPAKYMSCGEPCNPHEDFQCLTGDSRIDFGGGIVKCFRRPYRGPLTELVTEDGRTLRATPNHPVLTAGGWKPIGCLNESDQLIDLSKDLLLVSPIEIDVDHRVSTIDEIFETLLESHPGKTFMGSSKQFHGDGSDGYVDVVFPAWDLRLDGKAGSEQGVSHLDFTGTNLFALARSHADKHPVALCARDISATNMGGSGQGFSFVKGHARHPDSICFGTIADNYPSLYEPPTDDAPFVTRSFGNGQFALPVKVGPDDRTWVKLQAIGRGTPIGFSLRHFDFSGYVYNLETELGYYTNSGLVVSNCRCVAKPLVDTAYNAKFKVGDVYRKEP